MKSDLIIKQIKRIAAFAGGRRILRANLTARENHRKRIMGAKRYFTRIYEQNLWGEKKSVSGPRSTIERTQNIRKEIPRIFDSFGVKFILDAPCGDYNWFRLIERGTDIHYIGADIVEALVANNAEKYGDNYTRFICLDIMNDELPEADMWLCRDCLRHLSNSDIFKVISNLLNSDIKYFLASTALTIKKNQDILTGGARNLNLELPPFSFPKPILYIDDWIEGAVGRSTYEQHLALWEKSQLSESFSFNNALRRI